MKAYKKRLLLIAIIIPYITQGANDQGMINDIQNATQRVAAEGRKADEVEASLAQAQQLAATLGERGGEELLEDPSARLVTPQLQILQTLNEQYKKHYETVQNVSTVHGYQQRIQEQYDRIRTQADANPDNEALQNDLAVAALQLEEIERLSQQSQAYQNRIELAILTIQELTRQSVEQTAELMRGIEQAALQLARQPGLQEPEQQARTITARIITSLLEMEQDIKTLLDEELYGEALQAATVAQDVENALRQMSPDDINAMQTTDQKVQAAAAQVKGLIPVPPAVDEPPVDTQATLGQQPARPARPGPSVPTRPIAPTTPTRQRPAPPVGPSGRASANIEKVNLKLKSALRRLNAAKGYFNQIESSERAVVKKKAARIFKEYESGLQKFATRIKQVKAGGGNLDQAKLAPFDEFLDLFNKVSTRAKNL